MKSWKERGQDAKNRRRSQPVRAPRKGHAKKKKTFQVSTRYVGEKGTHIGLISDFFSTSWRNYRKYPTLAAAEQAVKILNRQDTLHFEYQLKPNEEDKNG